MTKIATDTVKIIHKSFFAVSSHFVPICPNKMTQLTLTSHTPHRMQELKSWIISNWTLISHANFLIRILLRRSVISFFFVTIFFSPFYNFESHESFSLQLHTDLLHSTTHNQLMMIAERFLCCFMYFIRIFFSSPWIIMLSCFYSSDTFVRFLVCL